MSSSQEVCQEGRQILRDLGHDLCRDVGLQIPEPLLQLLQLREERQSLQELRESVRLCRS